MDPNANLARQREIRAEIREIGERMSARWDQANDEENETLSPSDVDEHNDSDRETIADLADSLVSLSEALDEWITKGGFLPADWQH